MKKVVVGAEGASFEQLIKDGHNGALFKRENKESLISTILSVNNMSESAIKEMGERASKTIERMKPDIIRDQIENLYKDTINEYKTTRNHCYEDKIAEIKRRHNAIIKTYGKNAERYLLQ